jgi:hypothetical protein
LWLKSIDGSPQSFLLGFKRDANEKPMTVDEAVNAAADAASWDARVAIIRQVPERFGTALQQQVYSAIAKRIYVPSLAPDFAYVHWRPKYELEPVQQSYDLAHALTEGFTNVDRGHLLATIRAEPSTLLVFRLLLGFTTEEFAGATRLVAETVGIKAVSKGRIQTIESGSKVSEKVADCCALVVDLAMRRELFGVSPIEGVHLKTDKPDTMNGWESVRQYATIGVPLPVLLHQRLYGGAFRQLLDATSGKRGDILEDAVSELFEQNQIPFIRTGSHNQEEIAARFSLTVRPAPDFVVFDVGGTLKAMLECKGANNGGTARDKAARFRGLRVEATRLGGVPLFSVLAGLGWTRTSDALGPVIRDTDGRTFTIPTLNEMLTVQPFPTLIGIGEVVL